MCLVALQEMEAADGDKNPELLTEVWGRGMEPRKSICHLGKEPFYYLERVVVKFKYTRAQASLSGMNMAHLMAIMLRAAKLHHAPCIE